MIVEYLRRFQNVKIDYIQASDHPFTFQVEPVREWIIKRLHDHKVLNLFAGKTKLIDNEFRVDLSNEFKPHFHGSAGYYLDLCILNSIFYDIIIWDPPWNDRKSKEFYNGRMIGKFTKIKNKAVYCLPIGGIIISAGYEISNFGESRGMKLVEILIVNPGGEKRPYFITVEEKIEEKLLELIPDVPDEKLEKWF